MFVATRPGHTHPVDKCCPVTVPGIPGNVQSSSRTCRKVTVPNGSSVYAQFATEAVRSVATCALDIAHEGTFTADTGLWAQLRSNVLRLLGAAAPFLKIVALAIAVMLLVGPANAAPVTPAARFESILNLFGSAVYSPIGRAVYSVAIAGAGVALLAVAKDSNTKKEKEWIAPTAPIYRVPAYAGGVSADSGSGPSQFVDVGSPRGSQDGDSNLGGAVLAPIVAASAGSSSRKWRSSLNKNTASGGGLGFQAGVAEADTLPRKVERKKTPVPKIPGPVGEKNTGPSVASEKATETTDALGSPASPRPYVTRRSRLSQTPLVKPPTVVAEEKVDEDTRAPATQDAVVTEQRSSTVATKPFETPLSSEPLPAQVSLEADTAASSSANLADKDSASTASTPTTVDVPATAPIKVDVPTGENVPTAVDTTVRVVQVPTAEEVLEARTTVRKNPAVPILAALSALTAVSQALSPRSEKLKRMAAASQVACSITEGDMILPGRSISVAGSVAVAVAGSHSTSWSAVPVRKEKFRVPTIRHKADPFAAFLSMGRSTAKHGADPMAALLQASAPTERYSWDPISHMYKINVPDNSIYDPWVQMHRAVAPTVRSSADPLTHLFNISPPEDSHITPLTEILASTPTSDKWDPISFLIKADCPKETPEWDPLANLSAISAPDSRPGFCPISSARIVAAPAQRHAWDPMTSMPNIAAPVKTQAWWDPLSMLTKIEPPVQRPTWDPMTHMPNVTIPDRKASFDPFASIKNLRAPAGGEGKYFDMVGSLLTAVLGEDAVAKETKSQAYRYPASESNDKSSMTTGLA